MLRNFSSVSMDNLKPLFPVTDILHITEIQKISGISLAIFLFPFKQEAYGASKY